MQILELLVLLICTSIGLSAARSVITLVYASELSMRYFAFLIITACFAFFAGKGILTAVHVQLSSNMMRHIYLNLAFNALSLPLQA